ncbi:nicotinate-nucleotide/dimethylbenzimidazole phosphoribosyltransferase [Desulfobulbus propionicus DSM 2032]|jgi:nicotinate-nucleotide--dimethylbenzimidazole phosphoribosyltransferase|uniref:Nicotinate-nucleotide--dimethylbenzimidazole phosphoribosyltransferase n=1 Tax=Desulfobulbus propionicus (strain ATCC 33891 / DSM 2032 / VKM B-1956 / 1pr3) TaxID=577650 RepID=A0A7U4DNL8_DESPD|nr:nicotinate-nucleotide--dimethylbenzimidazole phosphoribosyltransferase [Desulfobulbus propionicus]ADW17231.1 nicotinate-nucleotide/dimethylbenzimidazole phosphoribosyltransferase [Desulfobulbus propionicus DSM 2032]
MNNTQAVSFLDATLRKVYPQDFEYRQLAEERLEQLTMPRWALGDLLDLAVDLAGMTRSLRPPVARKKVVIMVGDHGVTAEGVSKYPPEVTAQMVRNFVRGGAGINALARQAGAGVCVVDVGARDDFADLVREGAIMAKKIGHGTANMVYGPAMTRTHAVMAVEAGIEVANALAAEVDVLGAGEMGIGNTTPSTAIAAVFTGRKVAELTGRGTGIDDIQLANKIAVIEKALTRNKPNAKDGLDVLAKVGGFEIGAIAGLILGAAAHRKPVIVDGFISTAGAMIASSLEPFVRDYLICAHRSAEPGHGALLDALRLRPLLDLNLRLGEGSGAALAMNVVEAAVAILTEMATFAEAGVAGPR